MQVSDGLRSLCSDCGQELVVRCTRFDDSAPAMSRILLVTRSQQAERLQQIDIAAYCPGISFQSIRKVRNGNCLFPGHAQKADALYRQHSQHVSNVLEGHGNLGRDGFAAIELASVLPRPAKEPSGTVGRHPYFSVSLHLRASKGLLLRSRIAQPAIHNRKTLSLG